MPAVSVIMLTYNREGLVSRAIESVLNQTFQDHELILVDNGSTDKSGEICRQYAQQDSRVRFLRRERGNIGSGRNAGLELASGEYVAFVDDDDYCLPEFLDFLLRLARDHRADIAVCGSYKEENGELSPNGGYLYDELHVMDAQEAVENYLWRRLYNCAMPTKLVRRELFEQIRFPETGCYDDITTAYQYFSNAEVVAAHGLPHYVFYRHPGNNSSAATKHHLLNPQQLWEYLEAFRDRTRYISVRLPALAGLARYSEWSYMISMVEKINRFQLTNCGAPLEFMRGELEAHREEFLNGGFILDFERQWVDQFLGTK